MRLAVINQTIQDLCTEAEAIISPNTDWRQLTEEELLQEAATCIFGSQMFYEVSLAAAERLREHGLFRQQPYGENWQSEYEAKVVASFSTPLSVQINGRKRTAMPRFKNRFASLLAKTMATMLEHNTSLLLILSSAHSAREARKMLVEMVWGLGPKQASLFLRRVGFCSELAVLDTHVLDYLHMACGISPRPGSLSQLSGYERLETKFQRLATEFGHAVGSLDLAMWITMRVAKREALL